MAGLITGRDIIGALKDNETEDVVIIPKNMLKREEEIFLDDITVDDLEEKLKKKVVVCDYTGEDLIELINDNLKEE